MPITVSTTSLSTAQIEASPVGFITPGEPRWEFFKSQARIGDEIRAVTNVLPNGRTAKGYTLMRSGKFLGLTLVAEETP
jgi:hypothetical protein